MSDQFIAEIQAKLETKELESSWKSIKSKLEEPIKLNFDVNGIQDQLSNAIRGTKFQINPQSYQRVAKQIGQNYGKIISDSAQKSIEQVSSTGINKYFKVTTSGSAQFTHEMEKLVSDWTKGKGNLTDIKINTRTSFDESEQKNIERLDSAIVKYTNDLGESIQKRIAWRQIGTTQDEKGNAVPLRGFVEVASAYSKSIDQAAKKTDTFANKLKKTIADSKNTLKQISSNALDLNAAKPIQTGARRDAISAQVDKVNVAITSLGNASSSTFTDAKIKVDEEISSLKILIKEMQNAESTATSFRSKPIEVIRDETLSKVQGLEADIKKTGVSSQELEKYVSDMNSALGGKDIDTSGINDVLNTYAKAKAELSSLKKGLNAEQSIEKAQIKAGGLVSDINKVAIDNSDLSNFEAEINGVKTSVTSLITDLSQIKTAGDVSVIAEKWKAFSNAAKEAGIIASNTSKDLEKIEDSISSKSYDAQISSFKNKLGNYSNNSKQYKEVESSIKELENAYRDLKSAKDIYDSDSSTENYSALITANENLISVMKRTGNEMKILSSEQDKVLSPNSIASARKSFTSYFENNTKAAKAYKEEVVELQNQLDNMTTSADKMKFDTAFKNLQTKAIAEGNTGNSWIDETKRAVGAIATFTGAYGVLQGVMQDLPRQMIQNVSDVNDVITDLRMATSVSNKEAQSLMNTYFEMGNELKSLGTDVAASSIEWLKQGKSIKEADKLTKDSIILSKIGDLSSEDSTKTITAAMKSYNLAESEIMNFVDQISAIDMASATDVGGLSQAFNEVAANAKNAGVETKQLLSYAAVIGETTQEGMASVGTSLNAIFSRMGNIKLSRLKDFETGEDLSNVETVLRKVGISLRDASGEFRDFDEVLDEAANKWKTFDSVTQRATASSFAGTHHLNDFMILMDNWNKVQEYIATADNASGQSLEKFESYQDSIAGATEGFLNSFQKLSNTVISSDFLKGFIDSGTTTLDINNSLIDSFGSLNTILGVVGGAWATKTGNGKLNVVVYNAPFYKVA